MEYKVRILTVVKCLNKKTGEVYTRIDYAPASEVMQSPKVKGRVVAPFFITGHEAFDKIPIEFVGINASDVSAIIEYVPNPIDPMKQVGRLMGFKTEKNGTIDLV